jgi:hypothetical protein
MKIALIGAQGVGKTTFSKLISQKISDTLIVRETVRDCPYPVDQAADFKTEWWVLSHSILAEKEASETKSKLIITDRCLIDIAVYTKLIQEANDGRISSGQRSLIESTIQSWLKEDPYDHIFFIKVNPEVWKTRDLDDGFRSLDMGWYKMLTAEFDAALERLEVAKKTRLHVVHNDGKLDETLSKIMNLAELSNRESLTLS